jgi:hypothetical protein
MGPYTESSKSRFGIRPYGHTLQALKPTIVPLEGFGRMESAIPKTPPPGLVLNIKKPVNRGFELDLVIWTMQAFKTYDSDPESLRKNANTKSQTPHPVICP